MCPTLNKESKNLGRDWTRVVSLSRTWCTLAKILPVSRNICNTPEIYINCFKSLVRFSEECPLPRYTALGNEFIGLSAHPRAKRVPL